MRKRRRRLPVHAYLEGLHDALKETTGVLGSFRDPMPRSAYQSLTLQQHDPRQGLEWRAASAASNASSERGDDVDARLKVSTPELKVLTQWRQDKFREPLLVVAPVGSGKSCLLESFALELAEDALNTLNNHPNLPAYIPIAISLYRLYASHCQLVHYLCHQLGKTNKMASDKHALDQLLQGNIAVLLLDGFDEVPPAARRELQAQIVELRLSFALTSRPGHNAESVVGNCHRHMTLGELTTEQCHNYVNSYFTANLCFGFSPDDAVRLIDESLSGPLGNLLTRPLHLRSWCEYVHQSPRHCIPESRSSLAKQLLSSYVERRHLFTKLRQSDPHGTREYGQAVDAFSDWIGQFGCYVADRGFQEQDLSTDPLGVEIRNATLAINGNTYLLLDVAIDSGLVLNVGSKLLLLKGAVSEFCIGKYLAGDAYRNPELPTTLIETFRRWVWRPTLHDMLDFTFDTLWHAQNKQVRRWAEALIEWLLESGKCNSHWLGSMPIESLDDLSCPFTFTVFRLLQDVKPSDILNSKILKRVHDQYLFAWKTANRLELPLSFHLHTKSMKAPEAALVILSISQDCIASEGAHGTGTRIMYAVADAVVQREVPKLMEKLLLEYHRIDPQGFMKDEFWGIINFLAWKVSPRDAAQYVPSWIALHAIDPSERSKELWRTAIAYAALQLGPSDAVKILRDLLPKVMEPFSREDLQAWRETIGFASSRVGSLQAEILVEELINQWGSTLPDIDAAKEFASCIGGAAQQVAPERVVCMVDKWVRCANSMQRNLSCQFLYAVAVSSVVSNDIPDQDFTRVLVQLLRQSRKSFGDQEVCHVWRQAVFFAATSVSEKRASSVFGQLMARQEAMRGKSQRETIWSNAISGICSHVGEVEALALARYIMLHGETIFSLSEWAWILTGLSARVSPKEAPSLLEDLIVLRNQDSVGPNQRWLPWRLVDLIRRLNPSDASEVARSWIRRLESSGKDERSLWPLLLILTEQVNVEDLISIINYLMSVCYTAPERFDSGRTLEREIEEICGRVPDRRAGEAIRDWLRHIDSSIKGSREERTWQHAILGAIKQVSARTLLDGFPRSGRRAL